MRDFLMHNIDEKQLSSMKEQDGFLPCTWIRYNDKIKLAVMTDGYRPFERKGLEETCRFAKALLTLVMKLEAIDGISMENIAWNLESVYQKDEDGSPALIYLPTKLAEDGTSDIYVRRIYAILEEMLEASEGGDLLIRQIEHHKEKDYADWTALSEALDKRPLTEDDKIVLRSVNTPDPISFEIGHNDFLIGSDKLTVDGYLDFPDRIGMQHATIGWNEISFTIVDHGSAHGTYVNHTKLTPNMQVPIGKGSVIRFADLTFNVE